MVKKILNFSSVPGFLIGKGVLNFSRVSGFLMMKIMTAMYTMKKGGSYERFTMMLDAFLERGCAVHCLSLTPIQVQNICFHDHVLFYPFRNKENSMAKLTVLFFFPLWSLWIVWRNGIDLIVAFGFLYAFIQGFAKWFLKRSMVTLIRGRSSFGMKIQNSSKWAFYLDKFIEKVGLHFSDRIVTNNMAARDEILERLAKRKNIDVQVLYNNIPSMNIYEAESASRARNEYGIPEDAKILVTVGVLNRGKNIEALIKCLPEMGTQDVYVMIAGDGTTEADLRYKDFLRELERKLGVDKRVIFTGWLEKEELWKIYLTSDLFVLPSLNEGMPNAMLEALGSGLPCIGSNIPGIRDILQYDELLFDPLDQKNLTVKVRRLFSEGPFFEKVKRLCQERKEVFEFDWKGRMFEMAARGLDRVAKKS